MLTIFAVVFSALSSKVIEQGTFFRDRPAVVYADPIQYNDGILELAGEELSIAIAQTDSRRTRGLSDQKKIGINEGLFFDFFYMDKHVIWMRDMNFPIDIIWFDSNFVVVDVAERASPESFRSIFDAETFEPQRPARYVLEVAAGFVERTGLGLGAQAVLSK